ncbi:1,3(4)-beta-glucanase [Arthroderma uncinatum]|uniref:1,3(4)-beta-glucanase n=1 Tax=Arthroderma uncinatum TaxID=74035 RepID=UPI00144AC7FA|nr:1,3(4)-beta-glucanase [Arthroderma uncinatum]KAF3479501.1 1,3(4)-beta-glucanase [Arthroderma uncinatum]
MGAIARSLLACSLVGSTLASYSLVDNFEGSTFFSNFDFFTGGDPTHGFVKYVGEDEARSAGLIAIESSYDGREVVRMGADHENVTPDGRPSVRITSKKSYNQGLWIIDFAHVPGAACGSWPAYWLLGPNWPTSGEIDIYEGINLDFSNTMTLHTGQNCTISKESEFTGRLTTPYCDQNAPPPEGGNGCTIKADDPASYSSGLNIAGGGVYATEWTTEDIKIWFFPLILGIPSDIQEGNPDPSNWGTPVARFAGNCSFTESFKDMQIIFDITFCGDWAGKPEIWEDSPCSAITSECKTFVENFPGAFEETYWSINSLKVYQRGTQMTGQQLHSQKHRRRGHRHQHSPQREGL